MEGTDTVYLFVARKAEADLCSEYAEAIRQTLKEFAPQGIYHFKDIFAMLMNIGKHRSFNLFIDEFQDFPYVNPAIYSDIQDVWDRKTIAACLELPPLKEAQQANVFSEYGYYDEETKKTGYIDLLYEKDGVYTIVDYKTSEIDDPAYVEQLHAYRRNVCRLFHVDESKVRLYLVSLKKKQYASIP